MILAATGLIKIGGAIVSGVIKGGLSLAILEPLLKSIYDGFLAERVFAKPLISEALCTPQKINVNPLNFSFSSMGIFDLVGLAMVAGIFFSISLFLAGRIFGNSKLETFMKTEIIELLITYAAVVIGIGILYIPCNITWVSFGNIKLNLYESAFVFLQHLEAYAFLSMMIGVSMAIAFFYASGLKITINVFGGLSLPAFVGVSSVFKPVIGNAISAISIAFVLYSIQVLLYEVLTFGSIKYLLPLGIFMRAFSPLKKLGGVIIGFSLGVVIFYTLILAVGWQAIDPYLSYYKLTITKDYQATQTVPGYYEVNYDVSFGGDTKYYQIVYNIDQGVKDVEKEFENVNNAEVRIDPNTGELYNPNTENYKEASEELAKKVDPKISGIVRFFTRMCQTYFILLLIYPAIMLIFVVTGVRFMARFFGMDIDISNLTRVI